MTTQPAPFNLTEVDRQVLSQTDDEFVPHDWENLKDIICKENIALFAYFTRAHIPLNQFSTYIHAYSIDCIII